MVSANTIYLMVAGSLTALGLSLWIVDSLVKRMKKKRNEIKGDLQDLDDLSVSYDTEMTPEKSKEPASPDPEPKKQIQEPDAVYYKSDERNVLKTIKGFKQWRAKRKFKKKPDQFVLVRMTMVNEVVREWIVRADAKGFKFNKGRYIFDDTNKFFNATAKMWCYNYSEQINLPIKTTHALNNKLNDTNTFIKKKINLYNVERSSNESNQLNVDELKEHIESAGVTDVENAVNPISLERYLVSDFIQSLIKHGTTLKILKIILIIVAIVGFFAFGSFILDLQTSGVLGELGIGGGE